MARSQQGLNYAIELLCVMVGGSVGCALRYFADVHLQPLWLATLVVNLIGSFLVGVFAGCLPKNTPNARLWRCGFLVGGMGAFTTFSAFSMLTVQMLSGAHVFIAILFVLGNILGSLGLTALALRIKWRV